MKPQPSSPVRQCDILILTGSVGSGHVSTARAISEALYRCHEKDIRVDIVDFMTALKNVVTTATKTIYLGSLKISPKLYDVLFRTTSATQWPVKVLNAISAPFMQEELLEMLIKKRPRVLVSTYPVWDILARKIWDAYCANAFPKKQKLPFVSVITDAMSVHGAWIGGNADYYIVANEDTKVSLKNRGISNRRIKTFGYPVAHCFHARHSNADFQQKWNLSPKKKTLLWIVSTGTRWLKIKKLIAAIQSCKLTKMQLVIVAAGEPSWERKLKREKWPCPARITGWTNEMHSMIHGTDIVITKAGGATVMECIASAKPMMIFDAIPGQEIGNATLVQKYNLGAVLQDDAGDFETALQSILENEARVRKNLLAQQRPHAAEDTARFLLKFL